MNTKNSSKNNSNSNNHPSKMIFVKKEAVGVFGNLPSERSTEQLVQGSVVNLDKPKGPTSHQVSDFVKKIMHLSKAGHSGTLDPQVTGVQPVALGKATKITQFLLTSPKEYVCLMHVHQDIDLLRLELSIQKFVGKIQQLPPIKSAVKRELRTREIYDFELLEIKGKDVLFRVKCQAGTYIRKLVHDLGKELGTGAHMAELRRTQAGPFTEKDNLVTLNDLEDAEHYYTAEQNDKYLRYCLQPIENAVKYLSKCWILDSAVQSLTHGRNLGVPGVSKMENFPKGDTVAIMTLKGELVAVGEALMSAVEINTKEKGLAIRIDHVFMDAIYGDMAGLIGD